MTILKIIWQGRANVVHLNLLFLVVHTLVIGSVIVKRLTDSFVMKN